MHIRNVEYFVRAHRPLRRICKLLLNLAILSLLGFLVWFGLRLFTGTWGHDPLLGGLIFVLALAGFIWLSWLGVRSYWQPSMKVTVLSLVALFFIFAFAGVQPLADYKDTVVGRVVTFFGNDQSTPSSDEATPSPSVVVTYEELFNQFRRDNGLSPLSFTGDLNSVAGSRVAEIKVDFSHDSMSGCNLHLGENIAMRTGYLSDLQALAMWENSPGHRANMLGSDYSYTGYANSGGYAVQVFSQFTTVDGVPQLPPGWYWTEEP